MKKIFQIVLFLVLLIGLSGCGGDMKHGYNYKPDLEFSDESENEFQEIIENDFIKSSINNKSNISLSSNTASYSFIRGQILNGQNIDSNVVRTEEMINFFEYDYNEPNDDDIFGFKSELFKTPWNNKTYLLYVGMQTKKMDLSNVANNIVLLVDVSGSMSSANKLPLVKEALEIFVEQMGPNDLLSLVTYSSGEEVVFKGLEGNQYDEIMSHIKNLKAYGATAGKKGLEMAYQVAEELFIEEGNNRIILATDGDFNVGISDTDSLVEYISEKRDTGIYFSGFGFGYGNYKDEKLERISAAGNGSYYYIDDILSARKAFVDGIDGLLYTVARDAKAQIEFNSDVILEHRLIGYENRQLTDYEFDDETTDAGEIGTGLQVTAVYEVKLSEQNDSFGKVTVRYKSPNQSDETNYEQIYDLDASIKTNTPSLDAIFISSVVEFSLILRNSKYKNDASLNTVLEKLEDVSAYKNDYYKNDFIELVKKYQLLIK